MNTEKNIPLESLGDKLLQQYREHSYAESTVCLQKQLLHMIQRRIQKASLPGYSPTFGAGFLDWQGERVCSGEIKHLTYNLYRTLIRRLDDCYFNRDFKIRMVITPAPLPRGFQNCLARYLNDCAENGNRQSTMRNKRDCCFRFFANLMSVGCSDLEELGAEKICKAVLMEKNRHLWRLIRQFLVFLTRSGITDKDFSYLIPRFQEGTRLPCVYDQEEISRVEMSIDRSTSLGKRNYAMLLLASRLGIRRSDISALTIQAIDFDRKQISFTQLKTDIPITLPLLTEIEEALRDYIEKARPPLETDTLFIRSRAPYQGIGREQLRNVTAKSMELSGINTLGKKQGPHSLRASFATAMVNNGVSFEVVREALGHKDPGVLKHYARLDVKNLRACAMAPLPPTGFFKDFLEGRSLL